MPPTRQQCQRLKGLTPSMPIQMSCEWKDCQEEFTAIATFSSHVTEHLQTVLHEVKNRGEDIEDESEEEYLCEWQECHQETSGDFIALVRHVYFHVFHAKLKSYGSTVITSNNLDPCNLDPTSRNMIPELPDRLQCGWKECEELCDNPDYFYNHVSSHINVYARGNYINGGALCLWEGCDVTVKSRYRLREHLRSHTQEKVIACPTCGGLFSNTTKLFDHLRRQVMSDVQTYQCSHCNKRCATERLLRDHMRHHVNHYKCPFCDMTCPNPSGLRSHIKYRHSDDKPYCCNQCEYRCKGATDLRRHMLHTHSSGFFKCHIDGCNFAAGSYFTLNAHFKQDHQGMPAAKYQCHLCVQAFTRGTNLTNHLKKGHKFKWPSGHKRFRYKMHEDGIYRLQTIRYESIELTQQLLTDKIQHQGGPTSLESAPSDDSAQDSGPISTQALPTATPSGDTENQSKPPEADLSYNLEMLGDVALTLPKGPFSQHMDSELVLPDAASESIISDKLDCFPNRSPMLSGHSETESTLNSRFIPMSAESSSQCQGSNKKSPCPSPLQTSKRRKHNRRKRVYTSSESDNRKRLRHIIIEPRASASHDYHNNDIDDYCDMPLDLTASSSDIAPMMGPTLETVDISENNTRTGDAAPSVAPSPGRHIHQLQPVPAVDEAVWAPLTTA